jgi:hypothetical protein
MAARFQAKARSPAAPAVTRDSTDRLPKALMSRAALATHAGPTGTAGSSARRRL